MILSLSSSSFAQDAVLLNTSDPAPFSGFLLPKDKLQDLKNQIDLIPSYKKTIDFQTNIITLQQDKFKTSIEQNVDLTKALNSSKSSSDFDHILWFSLGVLASILSFYGATEITKSVK